MIATELEIVDKLKQHETSLASLDNFLLRRGRRIDAATILQPTISLYCLDDRRRRAVFVETPRTVNLSAQPFWYHAQYRHAVRLIAVSYDTFHALADGIGDCLDRLIVIFSLGRSGSTVLGRAFGDVPDVSSVSELDVYTQIASQRADGQRDDEWLRLLRSTTRLVARREDTRTLVVKPRAIVLDSADLFHRLYPTAKFIFLHRDLDDWARSMIRAFGAGGCPESVARVLARQPCVRADVSRDGGARSTKQIVRRLQDIPGAHALGLMWIGLMDRAAAHRDAGIPLLSLSYDALVGDPARTLRDVFEYCGLPSALAAGACRAFDEDAQRDTPLARARLRARALPVDRQLRLVKGVVTRCER